MNQQALQKLRNEFKRYSYKCQDGCYQCCTAVPILPQELKLMKEALLKQGVTEPPKWKGPWYCDFLTASGTCSVYNQRPIICRAFSNIQWVFKKNERKVKTWSCTYWEAKEIDASTLFIEYGKESLEKSVVLSNVVEEMIAEVNKNPLFSKLPIWAKENL